MLIDDIPLFETSGIVKGFTLVSLQYQEDVETFRTKIRVELDNGWLLDCWERSGPGDYRYSFHVFEGNRQITRWDNAAHHSYLDNFPHHQHVGNTIVSSEEMDVAKVLAQLESIM